jgi:(p)ppGpp synthase/HD superfamily hydrolase
MTIVGAALAFALVKHKGQEYEPGVSYIRHPLLVCEVVRIVAPKDTALLAAALLHDVVEDCGVTYEELVTRFGQEVADLVMEVTHEGKADNHGYYFPRLHTKRGIMLKFADRLCNIAMMKRSAAWDDERIAQYLRKSKFWNAT